MLHFYDCVMVSLVKVGGARVVTKAKPKEKPDPDAFDEKYKDSVSPMGMAK